MLKKELISTNKQTKKRKIPIRQQSSDSDEQSSDVSTPEKVQKSSVIEAAHGNEKWAQSLAGIVGQIRPKGRKLLTFSKVKSKKLPKNDPGFEIDGEIVEEKFEIKLERNPTLNLRIKPSLMDADREKSFKRIATKGVVQLFNAVRTQQKELAQQLDDVGPLDHKRDAVLNNINKKKFLDVLMGGPRAKSEFIDNPIKDEIKSEEESDDGEHEMEKKSQWSVLSTDFMTDKKLSHWDKDENEEDEGPAQTDDESGED